MSEKEVLDGKEVADPNVLKEHEGPDTIQISFEGKPAITIWSDGRVTLEEDYTTEEAAMIFWEAVNAAWPPFLARTIERAIKSN